MQKHPAGNDHQYHQIHSGMKVVTDAVADAVWVESMESGIEERPYIIRKPLSLFLYKQMRKSLTLIMTADWLAVAVATEAEAESDAPALEDALAAEVETAYSQIVNQYQLFERWP